MSRITRFASRDPGAYARMTGFMAHLRDNGIVVGPSDTALAIKSLGQMDAFTPEIAKPVLKAICTGTREDFDRFDDLFAAYWMDAGRVRQRVMPKPQMSQKTAAGITSSRDAAGQDSDSTGAPTTPDDGDAVAQGDGRGKLIASDIANVAHQDLRKMITPDDIAAAQKVAEKLGRALSDKRSRRRKNAARGARLNFRKTLRASIATGGEPVRLYRKSVPERDARLTLICDVSGSMDVYARVFLAFVAGVLRGDDTADAYVFHTKLLRITNALHDRDSMRAITKLSLMAQGYGGGSKIAACLDQFAKTYARRLVNGRNVVVIMSDGYDTSDTRNMGDAMRTLRKRGCRIIWLNPVKGWRDYEPITDAMAQALPYLDLFTAANTLGDLASLEKEFLDL